MATPDNLNTLSSVQFKFDILRIPNVSFFMQTAMIPGIDMDMPQHDTPRRNYQVTGSKLTYDPLLLTFIVDEDLGNYLEIYRWMQSIIRTDEEHKNKSDGALHILNGQMNLKAICRFSGIYPASLTELNFGVNDSDNITTVATVTFNYEYFDFPGVSYTMGNDDLANNNVTLKTIDNPETH